MRGHRNKGCVVQPFSIFFGNNIFYCALISSRHAWLPLTAWQVSQGVRQLIEKQVASVPKFAKDHVAKKRNGWSDSIRFLHGSGPFLIPRQPLDGWALIYQKPIGSGVTFHVACFGMITSIFFKMHVLGFWTSSDWTFFHPFGHFVFHLLILESRHFRKEPDGSKPSVTWKQAWKLDKKCTCPHLLWVRPLLFLRGPTIVKTWIIESFKSWKWWMSLQKKKTSWKWMFRVPGKRRWLYTHLQPSFVGSVESPRSFRGVKVTLLQWSQQWNDELELV